MSSKIKIVIIDYGVGNTHSVSNAIKFLGYSKLRISHQEKIINEADVLIFPGVGAFEEAVNNLKIRNLDEILNEQVLIKKKPILGICLGMQMFATQTEENGIHKGFDWIEGYVKKLEIPLNDNSIDIVYTSHSIEPNGGKEEEALKELYRITKKYLILLEPSFEFAGTEARGRMKQHGYVSDLFETAKRLNYKIIEHRHF